MAWPRAGGDTWLTSSMTEETFLGGAAGCEQGLAAAQRVSSVQSPVPLRAAGRGGCISPGIAALCSSRGGWSQLRRAAAHTWGADTVSTPGASWQSSSRRLPAAGTNRDGAPPGARGRGMSQWGGGGAVCLPCLFEGMPLPHTPIATHRGESGASQPRSSLLGKKEHVAALESMSGSAWALATLDTSPCALLHLFLPPSALVKAEPTCSDLK